jgi:hypothetical protein
MAKPYFMIFFMDLRAPAVCAVLKGALTASGGGPIWPRGQHGDQWVRRFQDTGSVAPLRMGGHKPKAITGEHHTLVQRIREREFTLRGLAAELAECGLKVDYRSVWNFVHGEKAELKKQSARANAIAPTLRAGEQPSGLSVTSITRATAPGAFAGTSTSRFLGRGHFFRKIGD